MSTRKTSPRLVEMIPNEIWTQIFRASCLSDTAPKRYYWLYDFIRVCRRWHGTIMADALLWCKISIDCSPLLVSQLLERSKHNLLEVECDIDYHEDAVDTAASASAPSYSSFSYPEEREKARMLVFSNQVLPSIHRWSSLNIRIAYFDLEPFAAMLETPAPRLQTLSIQQVDGHEIYGQLKLFDHQAANLLAIHLARVLVVWDSPIFSGLRSLTLECLEDAPSGLQIYNILNNCPELEYFEANGVFIEDPELGEGSSLHQISLPYLRKIRIRTAYCEVWSEILQRISSLPSCQALELLFDAPGRWPRNTPSTFLSSTLLHLHQDIVRMFNSPLKLHFFDDGPVGITTLGQSCSKVSFTGDVNILDQLLAWTMTIVEAVPQPLPIVLAVSTRQSLEKLHLIPYLQVVALEIEDRGRSTKLPPLPLALREGYIAVLNALGGKSSGEPEGSFAFPLLRIIRLNLDERDIYQDDLLEMVRRRWAAVRTGKEKRVAVAEGKTVRPFKVSFRAPSPTIRLADVMGRVAAVIGPENVVFAGPMLGNYIQQAELPYTFERDHGLVPYLSVNDDD